MPRERRAPRADCVCAARTGGEPKRSLWDLLYQDCVKSPYVWLFAIAYFFVYVVRQGVTSWFIFYLQARRVSGSRAVVRMVFVVLAARKEKQA